MDVKVIDKDGTWFVNRSEYRHVDPETNIIFEPGLATRVNPTQWLKDQPMMFEVKDPFSDEMPAAMSGEQILRENPDNVAGNSDAAPGSTKAATGGAKK